MAVTNRALRTDSERTRRRIIESARDLCRQEGYEHVRMADIAKRVGCSRATVYNHFLTRDDLLEALCVEYLDGFLDLFGTLSGWLEPHHTVFDVLRETVATELRWRTEHDALRGALDSARRLRKPFYVEAERRIDQAMLAWFSQIYVAAAQRGLLRCDLDAAKVSGPLYAMTDSVVAAFPVGAVREEIDRAADEVARLQWYALCSGDPDDAPEFSSLDIDLNRFAAAHQRHGSSQ